MREREREREYITVLMNIRKNKKSGKEETNKNHKNKRITKIVQEVHVYS